MSVADTLADAVADLDRYIAEQAEGADGWGEANPRGPYFGELLDVRDRMNKLREKIDGLYATKDESVVMDFGFKAPEATAKRSPDYEIVSRVAMSLGHAKAMLPGLAKVICRVRETGRNHHRPGLRRDSKGVTHMTAVDYPHVATDAPGFSLQETTYGHEEDLSVSEVLERVNEILGYDLLEHALMVEGYREMGAEMLLISESTLAAQFEAISPE